MSSTNVNRPLTEAERRLTLWMLEHGSEEAIQYIPQVDLAEVAPWRCPCGCASINFKIKDKPEAVSGLHVLGDFLLGSGDDVAGIFVFASGGVLGGIEVYGMAGDAPKILPEFSEIRPF